MESVLLADHHMELHVFLQPYDEPPHSFSRLEHNISTSNLVIRYWRLSRFRMYGHLSVKRVVGFWLRFSPLGKWKPSSAK
jgi:hypothetical protein